MEAASRQNKQVPDRMHITGFLPGVKNNADGIEQAAQEQQKKSIKGNQLHQWFDAG